MDKYESNRKFRALVNEHGISIKDAATIIGVAFRRAESWLSYSPRAIRPMEPIFLEKFMANLPGYLAGRESKRAG